MLIDLSIATITIEGRLQWVTVKIFQVNGLVFWRKKIFKAIS